MLTVVHFNKNSFEANEFVDHGWVKWIWPSSSPKTGRVYSLQGQEKTWRDIHTTVFVESDVPSKVTVTEPFWRYGLIWCKRLKQTNRSPFWAVNKLRLSLEIVWCQWGMTWSDTQDQFRSNIDQNFRIEHQEKQPVRSDTSARMLNLTLQDML